MLKIGQRITLSGETVQKGIDDVAIVDGFEMTGDGYVVHLFFPGGLSAKDE